jgi:hypothetical protein
MLFNNILQAVECLLTTPTNTTPRLNNNNNNNSDSNTIFKSDPDRSRQFLECKNLTVEKKKKNANNNRVNWSHFNIVRKIPEQLNAKARHQAILGTGHIPRIVVM